MIASINFFKDRRVAVEIGRGMLRTNPNTSRRVSLGNGNQGRTTMNGKRRIHNGRVCHRFLAVEELGCQRGFGGGSDGQSFSTGIGRGREMASAS